MIQIDNFINEYVIKRPESMFKADIQSNTNDLDGKMADKTFLVIGGAGSIGS